MKTKITRHSGNRSGFALVLAIMAMAFMVLLVLALSATLSLQLRLLNRQKENRIARSNAVLGMSAAISELQRMMGPDNAISFSASIFDADSETLKIDGVKSPHIIGVQKISTDWRGKSFAEKQNELRNTAESLKTDGDNAPGDIVWLVSSFPAIKDPIRESVAELNKNTVRLARFKSLQEYPDELGGMLEDGMKEETDINAGVIGVAAGSYAWWISDESMKAKVNLYRPNTYLDGRASGNASDFEGPSDRRLPQVSDLSFIKVLSGHQFNPFLKGFEEKTAKMLEKMTALDEIGIFRQNFAEWAQANKGDYTGSSMGLAVDVSQGRLKEDLSAYLANTQADSRDSHPIIRGHAADINYMGPDLGIDNYDINLPRLGFLKDFAKMARQGNGENLDFEHAVRPKGRNEGTGALPPRHGIYPVVASAAYTFQLCWKKSGDSGSLKTGDSIELFIMLYPRIFLWNPHNVRLEKSDYVLRLHMPYFLEFGAWNEPHGKSLTANDKTGTSVRQWAMVAKFEPVELIEDSAELSKRIWFAPELVFKHGGLSGGVRKNFSEFIADRSLPRGKRQSASGGLQEGYPVINLKIAALAMNPGETIELCALGSALVQYDNSWGGKSGVLQVQDYPRLVPGRMSDDSLEVDSGTGVLIKTGITLKASSLMEDGVGGGKRHYANYLPPSSGEGFDITAFWRIAPVLEEQFALSGEKFPRPGYELWLSGGDCEYLTGMDPAVFDENGQIADEYAGINNALVIKGVGRDGYYHVDGQSPRHAAAMFGAGFSSAHFWNNTLMSSSAGSPHGNSGIFSIDNIGEDGKPEPMALFGNSAKRGELAVPIIPNADDLARDGWQILNPSQGTSALVFKYMDDTSSGDGYQSSKGSNSILSYAIMDKRFAYDFFANKAATQSHNWVMAGLYSSQPASGPFLADENSRGPAYLSLANHIRDNGSVARVNANHGYLAMPIRVGLNEDASSLKNFLFVPDPSRTVTGGFNFTGGLTSMRHARFSFAGKWDYLQSYESSGDDYKERYGMSPLFSHIAALVPNNDTAFAMPIFDYPRFAEDIMSLGVFAHANLSMSLWQPAFAFAQSHASPYIPRDKIVNDNPLEKVMHANELIDISYMLNASMWDRFFLSTMPQDVSIAAHAGMRLLNVRHVITSVPQNIADLCGENAYEKSAAFIGVDGAFNVNSTSYEAWRSFLGGMMGVKKRSILEGDYPSDTDDEKLYMPNPGNINPLLAPQPKDKGYGYRDSLAGRDISNADIDALAREITAEVKRRAPFFCLADFVNRRLAAYEEVKADKDMRYASLMGTVDAAIQRLAQKYSGASANPFNMYGQKSYVSGVGDIGYAVAKNSPEYIEHAKLGPMEDSYMHLRGLPGVLKQSQILTQIGPFITVRGDTFTIRAYGECNNPLAKSVVAAYCEAVVQRSAAPFDEGDDIIAPKGVFGRRLKIISFRWLSKSEL